MTGLEITLLIIGVVFLLGSFFVQEKLSQKDIDQISDLSEREMQIIVEKQLKSASGQVEDMVSHTIEDSMDETKRALEKTTNQKIMAISEYSDTVLDSMNKTHNEIMFLYSMLNDKHTELTNMAGQLQKFTENVRTTENEVLQKIAQAAEEAEQKNYYQAAPPPEETAPEEAYEAAEEAEEEPYEGNQNSRILYLHQEGLSDVEIARELGCGLGEVRLVIGLFKGEGTIEA